MNQDIEIAGLTAESAARLRALFEASAGAARQGGGEAEEAFLLGLAGLMDTYAMQRSVTTGEPMPAPVTLGGKPAAIDTGKLTAPDALAAAHVCIGIAERFTAEGKDALGGLFTALADKLGGIVKAKIAAQSSGATIQ